MIESEGQVGLSPREIFKLKKLLNGNGPASPGQSNSSTDEAAFDPDELKLLIREAVSEELDERGYLGDADPKNSNSKSQQSAKPGQQNGQQGRRTRLL